MHYRCTALHSTSLHGTKLHRTVKCEIYICAVVFPVRVQQPDHRRTSLQSHDRPTLLDPKENNPQETTKLATIKSRAVLSPVNNVF